MKTNPNDPKEQMKTVSSWEESLYQNVEEAKHVAASLSTTDVISAGLRTEYEEIAQEIEKLRERIFRIQKNR